MTLPIYLNEFDPFAADWLRNLMAAGEIPNGVIDARDIRNVQPADIVGRFRQCHFFSGIAGWPLALKLAGWPDDRECWSGSCPCQPFSVAGKRRGQADERHLWPEFFRLIRECHPATVFGEQVPGAIGHGWWDEVAADLEAEGYACGAVVLGAHSVGAPHIRQRIYWVASDTNDHHGDGWGGTLQVRGQRSAEAAHGNLRQEGSEWATEPRPVAVAYGVPNRLGRLNGFGNAIVPQVAAEFIRAFLAPTCPELSKNQSLKVFRPANAGI